MVVNGETVVNKERWSQTLQSELANRYTAAGFCSWWATGGSIQNILPRPYQELLDGEFE